MLPVPMRRDTHEERDPVKPRYYLLTFIYCAGLFWLSSSENPVNVRMSFSGEDKIVHAVLYAGLASVVSVGMRRSGIPKTAVVQFWVPILFATLYGMSDELHQRFVPHRTCDIWDAAADAFGAFVVQLFLCRCVWGLRLRGTKGG